MFLRHFPQLCLCLFFLIFGKYRDEKGLYFICRWETSLLEESGCFLWVLLKYFISRRPCILSPAIENEIPDTKHQMPDDVKVKERSSGRERKPTDRMTEYMEQEATKREKRCLLSYDRWKLMVKEYRRTTKTRL